MAISPENKTYELKESWRTVDSLDQIWTSGAFEEEIIEFDFQGSNAYEISSVSNVTMPCSGQQNCLPCPTLWNCTVFSIRQR